MSEKETGKKSTGESARDQSHPFVISESEIRNYVEDLGIHDVSSVATRFQLVADLTKRECDQLAQTDLQRIKRIAAEDSNRNYRRIMQAIIIALGEGKRGIESAHLTANVAVQMIFRWSPEYFSALNGFREELRKRKLTGASRRRTSRRSELRLVAGH